MQTIDGQGTDLLFHQDVLDPAGLGIRMAVRTG